jgi:hypothetical protein
MFFLSYDSYVPPNILPMTYPLLLHSIMLQSPPPTLNPTVPHPRLTKCKTIFSFHYIQFEDEDYSLHQNTCTAWRHKVAKPQKRMHTLDRGHKSLPLRTTLYHMWLSISWWNVLLPSLTLETESVNFTKTLTTTYQTARCHNADECSFNFHCHENLKPLISYNKR